MKKISDEDLREIGRHLGVMYDANGDAIWEPGTRILDSVDLAEDRPPDIELKRGDWRWNDEQRRLKP